MRRYAGFTLIEVLVTISIVAILAAIAIPNYSQYVQKTRRTDAQEKLLDMAALQERWFFSNNSYTDKVGNLGGAASKDGYYTVTITNLGDAPFRQYTLTATPTGDRSQVQDKACTRFTITNTGEKQAFKDDSNNRNDDVCWPK